MSPAIMEFSSVVAYVRNSVMSVSSVWWLGSVVFLGGM